MRHIKVSWVTEGSWLVVIPGDNPSDIAEAMRRAVNECPAFGYTHGVIPESVKFEIVDGE